MLLILFAFSLLVLPLRWLAAISMAVVVHEMGHFLALKITGVKIHGVRIDFDGIRLQTDPMNRVQELFCAAAGPMAGLCLLLISKWLPRTAICACFHSLYNLLPVYPMDGGRILKCLCKSRKVCQLIAYTCITLIFVAGLYGWAGLGLGFMPVGIALLTIQRMLKGKGLENRHRFGYNRCRILK